MSQNHIIIRGLQACKGIHVRAVIYKVCFSRAGIYFISLYIITIAIKQCLYQTRPIVTILINDLSLLIWHISAVIINVCTFQQLTYRPFSRWEFVFLNFLFKSLYIHSFIQYMYTYNYSVQH